MICQLIGSVIIGAGLACGGYCVYDPGKPLKMALTWGIIITGNMFLYVICNVFKLP